MTVSTPRPDLSAAWDRFLADHEVDTESLLATLPDGVERSSRVRELVRTYLDEGPVAVALVAPHLSANGRILEVGSGIGLVSRFLADLGHEVVATEPSPDGFDLMRDLTAAVDAVCGPVGGHGSLRRLDLGVDDLTPAELGRFDLVFSANVIEHVPDPEWAIVHLQRFVSERGVQVHVCPNYAFPYDPHIRRPLVPFAPRVTRHLLPRRLGRSPEFRSVNFVTARRLQRAASSAGLELVLEPGQFVAALDRFAVDPTFAARHAGLEPAVRAVRILRLDRLLRRIPPRFASPMRFTVGPAVHGGP